MRRELKSVLDAAAEAFGRLEGSLYSDWRLSLGRRVYFEASAELEGYALDAGLVRLAGLVRVFDFQSGSGVEYILEAAVGGEIMLSDKRPGLDWLVLDLLDWGGRSARAAVVRLAMLEVL